MKRATWREEEQLRASYVVPAADLRPGVGVQFLANGGWPYEAIVLEVKVKRVYLEYTRRGRGGHKYRTVDKTHVFVSGALGKLRTASVAARQPALDAGEGRDV